MQVDRLALDRLSPSQTRKELHSDRPLSQLRLSDGSSSSRSGGSSSGGGELTLSGKIKGKKTKLFRRRSAVRAKGEFVWSDVNFDRTFSLDSEIGRGSCGTVWKGRHRETGTTVAIKKLELFGDTVMELLPTLQQVRHPSIIVHYGGLRVEMNEHASFVWLVTEFCANGSLADLVIRHGGRGCTEREIAAFTVPVLQGLSYLQSQGLSHGGVSARKIYVTDGFQAKLGGFGSPLLPDSTRVWPPEHAADPTALRPTIKWDVWDFGQTVLRLAVHRGANDGSVLEQMATSFSPEIQGFVDCCLLKLEKQRPLPSELLEHPFISHALNSYDMKDTIRKYVLAAIQQHPASESRERSYTASTIESPLLTLQALAEENLRLREEIRTLHWERVEHAALLREMLADLSSLRAHSANLERQLLTWCREQERAVVEPK